MTQKIFRGIGAAPGIIVGKALLFRKSTIEAKVKDIINPKYEWERFQLASAQIVMKLVEMENALPVSISEEAKNLIATLNLIVEDNLIQEGVRTEIFTNLLSAENAIAQTFGTTGQRLKKVSNSHIAEKIHDLEAVQDLLLETLSGKSPTKATHLAGKIVVGANFSPKDILVFAKEKIAALVCETGTRFSHVSILARNFNIPAVVGVRGISEHILSEMTILLDGNQGILELSPSEDQIQKFMTRKEQNQKLAQNIEQSAGDPCTTSDGTKIDVYANIDFSQELDVCSAYHTAGVGLYRFESFFLTRQFLPTEEDLLLELQKMVDKQQTKPYTVRLLDAGGDKQIPYLESQTQNKITNPAMSVRGVRVLLNHLDLLKDQCRAILKANIHANIQVLIPFVASVEEIRIIKDVFKREYKDLCTKHFLPEKIPPFPPIGTMIELPSAVAISSLLAKEVDFFSIGTNDLTQHTLAVDRTDPEVGTLFDSFHPAIIRSILHVITEARKANIPVSLCGELASEPLATELLMGMGLRLFSVGVHAIPLIKDVIRKCSINEGKELLDKALELSTGGEIKNLLSEHFKEKFGNDYFVLSHEGFVTSQSK